MSADQVKIFQVSPEVILSANHVKISQVTPEVSPLTLLISTCFNTLTTGPVNLYIHFALAHLIPAFDHVEEKT